MSRNRSPSRGLGLTDNEIEVTIIENGRSETRRRRTRRICVSGAQMIVIAMIFAFAAVELRSESISKGIKIVAGEVWTWIRH